MGNSCSTARKLCHDLPFCKRFSRQVVRKAWPMPAQFPANFCSSPRVKCVFTMSSQVLVLNASSRYRSIQIDCRQTLFLGRGGGNFQLQIQNRAARRVNVHYRDRSVAMSAEIRHYRYRFFPEFQLISITDTAVELKTFFLYHAPRKHYLPEKIFSNYFPITVSRFRFLRINFRKLPDTYCICVSCVTLPGWDPCPCRIIFYYRYPILNFSELIG